MITKHTRQVVRVAADQPVRETCREKLSSVLRDCPVKGWKIARSKDIDRSLRFAFS